MESARRAPELTDWREIANLGEQLVNTASLIAQRDRIIAMTRRITGCPVDVWLDEMLFRLPDWKAKRQFPPRPRIESMRRALARRKLYLSRPNKKNGRRKAVAAIPLEDQGFLMGVLQISRSNGPNFEKYELDLLESIAGVISVSLFASHRVEVERFRLSQLNLVGKVSAQIANVLDVDELASRITRLIQRTFNYYYVAIFTLRPTATHLRFRSSARAGQKGSKQAPLALEVELGQGLIGEAAASGERIIAPDVRSDTRFRFIEALPETQSEVVIPLKIENRVLGALDVQSNQLNAFHPNDLLLLQALADNIARAVEGARLYGDVQRRADQLNLVAEVSKSVNSTLELDELMNDAAQLIHKNFGYPHVYMFSVHPNRRLIEFEAGSGTRSQALKGYSIPLDDSSGIIPWVAREGKTLVANNVLREPRYRASPLPPKNTRAELALPLVFGDRILGVLDIQSDKLNAFSEDDQLMFEAVAGTIATSIRNADLYRSEQWRRHVGDSLREVAGLLSEFVGVEESLQAILVELERNLPVDVAAIWLVEDKELYLAAVHGVDAEAVEQARISSPEAETALNELMLSDAPVIRKRTDPYWPSGRAAGFNRNYSSLAASLRVSDQPVGVIALAHHAPGRYGHEAQAMIATFASYAAVAIENARLYDFSQEQAYATAALLQVAQIVVSLSDLDEILRTIVRTMPILVGVKRVVLYLWDTAREKYTPRQEYGLKAEDKAALTRVDFGAGEFLMLDTAQSEMRIAVHSLKPNEGPESWKQLKPKPNNEDISRGERLLIALPLTIKSDLFGVLLVEEGLGGDRYRGRRLEIVRGISQQIALAIQNDRFQNEMVVRERLETEIQLARQIQQAFIPETLPEIPGWELAARWETARQVGGDFYDVIELADGKLGLFIADVADKGMPAAIFMALTRTLVRAAVLEARSPAKALRRVNDLLIPDTRQGMFVTAFYAVLDPENGEFTYANAGQNPPLWLRANGGIEKLTRTGIALGIIENQELSERTIRIDPGESVLLYTDGLTEAFSPDGDLFGEPRLMETVRQDAVTSAKTLLDTIDKEISDFQNSQPLSDDLTMLVVRRK